MTQCMKATELNTDDTASYVNGFELKQGLSSEEVHTMALLARKFYGKAQKALTFCTNAQNKHHFWMVFISALVMLH